MRFPSPLVPATLIRRYKRFLADCRLEDGQEITAHCPNPGSMAGLAEPGSLVWLEPNDDPKKKLKFGWRLVQTAGGDFVGIDTGAANRIVREALQARLLPDLTFDSVRAEVRYGTASRIDFLLEGAQTTYLEVKSVTLSRQPGLAEFPDSVTARGAKHLEELAQMVAQGHRAVMLYLVQRTDCARVDIAGDIDPAYHRGLAKARAAGVEVMALGTTITPEGILATGPVAFVG